MPETIEKETVRLAQPVDDGFGEETEEIPKEMADRAKALNSLHPPTNANVIIGLIDYWNDISGYNDPVVKSAASWLCYLVNEDVSQFDAGMTGDQAAELSDRLEELGLADD